VDAFHPESTHFASKRNRAGHSPRIRLAVRRNEILELACLLPLSHSMKPAKKLRTSTDEARGSVRIEVLGGHAITSQARAYAEYRVFAALTQISESQQVQGARVVLRSVNGRGSCERVSCTVTVTLDGLEPLRVRTIGAHAYAAINRAVDRITAMGAPRVLSRISI
jgi:ribosome-associated translation inhibitor RaiA